MFRAPCALIFATVLLASASASADDGARPADAKDVLVLKSGGRVEGLILDEDPKRGTTIEVNGRRRTFKPKEIDHVEKWQPPKPEPKPAPPPPVDEEPPPPPPPPPPPALRDHVRLGVQADAAIFKAKSVGPWLGVGGFFDVGFADKFSLHFDPTIVFDFSRKTTVNALSSVTVPDDAHPDDPVVIQRTNIKNSVTGFGLVTHAQLGYDVAAPVTIRAGGIVGVTSAKVSSDLCSAKSQTGLLYGGGIGGGWRPIRALELGLQGDFVLLPIPKCDIPISGNITPKSGATTQFGPQIVNQRVQAIIGGLYVAYTFN